ncbi:hypothetical protein L226DRAFT_473395 [Lentinus tigrinus ALCF2SS1-7]|uniref:uncharacterized protein n=1 Tax=Lentinus tigrinus ALCF2SS1-7 TaxID=1328758 RepID=UPI0011662964|nr:hypothetical protein L226DRAFT_473395 [Lentinus tigrinus ALCF2SS1-7]
MHNLFLGELRHHCIEIWGLKGAQDRGKPRRAKAHTPEQQQEVLDQILRGIRKASVKTIKHARLDYLQAVARYNELDVPAKSTREGYANALLERVKHVGIQAFKLPPPMPKSSSTFYLPIDEINPLNEIFTRPVLDQLRSDIRQMFLPSWLEKPPSNIGDASHGKLKADHWRTLCTTSMVITLVRLWGSPSSSPEEFEVLENFMHLVAAVDFATRRSMNAARAITFETHMETYLRGIRSIYKVDLVSNHHLSLHLKECLLLFGPTHGWWAFPFERYNGLLQRLKTNQKPAEMALTFIRYFYIGATLRWLTEVSHWPAFEEFGDMLQAFRNAFNSNRKGTARTENILSTLANDESETTVRRPSKNERDLPHDTYDALLGLVNESSSTRFGSFHEGAIGAHRYLSPTAEFVRSIQRDAITYGTSAGSKRNSFILFSRVVNGVPKLVAGQIREIFYHTRTEDAGRDVVEPFFVVEEFRALSPVHQGLDPYRKFPDVPTWLCYNEYTGDRHVLRMQDITCHFAALIYTPAEIGQECIVVRSLDRVSPLGSLRVGIPQC